jgi:hypothetical protein
MRSRLAGCLAATIVTAALMAPLASAEDRAYRWVDNDGVVQYTQQPPKDRPSELIRVKTGTTIREGDGSEPAAPAASRDPKQEDYCAAASKNLGLLKGSGEITQAGPDGKPRLLTAAERQAELDRTQKGYDLYCTAAPK